MSSPINPSNLSPSQIVLNAIIPAEKVQELKKQTNKLSFFDRIVILFTGGGDRALKCFTEYKIDLLKHPEKHEKELEGIFGNLSDKNIGALGKAEVSKNALKSSDAFKEFLKIYYAPEPEQEPEYQGEHRTDIFGLTPKENPHKTPSEAYKGEHRTDIMGEPTTKNVVLPNAYSNRPSQLPPEKEYLGQRPTSPTPETTTKKEVLPEYGNRPSQLPPEKEYLGQTPSEPGTPYQGKHGTDIFGRALPPKDTEK